MIEVFDLTEPEGASRFNAHAETYLDVVDAAYGSGSHPRDFHLERVYRQRHTILVSSHANGTAIGIASVRPDGKLCAFGVAPSWRGTGIGEELIQSAVSRFGQLFCEVPVTNARMQTFVLRNGFKLVTSQARIELMLSVDAELIRNWYDERGALAYDRESRSVAGKVRRLVMLEI
jgi:ribosomal protein S18 acetylase RimI-like enzyme